MRIHKCVLTDGRDKVLDYYIKQFAITVETTNLENVRRMQLQRCIDYYIRIVGQSYNLKKDIYEKKTLKQLLDKESDFEKRIYEKMKKWEERHPIMGIVVFTILMGILISLLAGIILEAIY